MVKVRIKHHLGAPSNNRLLEALEKAKKSRLGNFWVYYDPGRDIWFYNVLLTPTTANVGSADTLEEAIVAALSYSGSTLYGIVSPHHQEPKTVNVKPRKKHAKAR